MAAPPILSLEELGLVQGAGWLMRGIDVHVGPQDRLALIGRNGVGKTTLLRLISGAIDFDEGRRKIVPGTNIVFLEQDPDFSVHARLIDFALAGPDAPPDHAVRAVADQIGIDLDREAATASGGERRRTALCRALASQPDLLLLDEPTNHLDLAAIEWLENWLERYRGAFIAISHDRTFLTRLTRSTLWLDRGIIRRQEIGFGGYEAWMEKVYAEEARAAEKLDARLKIEAHWLERGVTARRKRNQGRLAKLMDMRSQRAAMLGRGGPARLALADDNSKTKSVIVAQDVRISFGERPIVRNFSLRVQRGDRIGIVGPNGVGKTTLVRLLTGEITPDAGSVTLAKTLQGIIIDQQRRLMAPERRVRDVLANGSDWIDVRGVRKHVQGYLKEFLFDPALIDTKVGILSGGERSRLLLAREFARASNLLVLDEPTNDLDLETLDLLQEVIADFEGTVILVSHDRDFLDRTVSITLGLDGSGDVDVVAGGYADWEAQRSAPLPLAGGARGGRKVGTTLTPDPSAKRERRSKLSYKDQRDLDLLPTRITAIDAEIATAELALSDAGLFVEAPQKYAELTQMIDVLRAKKEAHEIRWLEVAEMAEALIGSD